VSVSGRWRFAFWERDIILRFILLFRIQVCVLAFSKLLTAQSNDLLAGILARAGFVDVDSGGRRGVGLMAKWTIERPLGDPRI